MNSINILPLDTSILNLIEPQALCDVYNLLEDHPVVLREIMGALPAAKSHQPEEKRGKFLALRDWFSLSSPHHIQCYKERIYSGGGGAGGLLWFKSRHTWIGENHLDTGLFPDQGAVPTQSLDPFSACYQDELVRHYTSKWLIQIEMQFQTWWKTSENAPLVLWHPQKINGVGPIDVTAHVLSLDPVTRQRTVATNILREDDGRPVSGSFFLHNPSDTLVQYRRAHHDACALKDGTRQSSLESCAGSARKM